MSSKHEEIALKRELQLKLKNLETDLELQVRNIKYFYMELLFIISA
jgi:hypothetical protein